MSGAFLTLNAGSSSIKFSIYLTDDNLSEQTRGQVENLGPTARLVLKRKSAGGDIAKDVSELGAANHESALTTILERSGDMIGNERVTGVGHRIAHGGVDFIKPVVLDDTAIAKLRLLEPLAPLHQPHNLKTVDAARAAFPDALQIGCFDTAFHRSHPWVNDTFALPRHYYERGVRRYGFHGLSYDFITGELKRCEPRLFEGCVVIAHLGNGASMCAVKNGRSIASTMGFSALDGLPMGTRCGQLDPGVLLYLMDHDGMNAADLTTLLYKESGLKGLSGLSHDMRELSASSAPEAKDALSYYAFRARREVGALAASLGGLDALVFTGGIGENSALMRSMITEDMGWLGIELDDDRNQANATDIGTGRIRVMVIPTDEERVIARALQDKMASTSA
ncbi:MAG: acetate/propionate family kinase [Pseudomonadota bacterium]